jgi:hypothetical protein
MTEIFKQRKVELEIAAKNTIVEIHLIKMNAEAITRTLEAKEKMLDSINASIRELDHLETLVNIEEKEAEKKEEEGSKSD